MKVSGLIANYNGGKKVVKSVKLCLEYCDEVIFVDDKSNDGSYEKVKKIKNEKLKIFRNKINSGASYSRNICAKKASFQNLLFVDNDCYFDKKNFKKILGFKEDIIYPRIIDTTQNIYNHIPGRYLQNSVCFFISKKNFKKVKGFDEKIRIYMDDVDFFFRCWKMGLKIKYIEDSKGFHDSKKSKETISNNFFKNLENTVYFCLKHKRFGISKEEFPNTLTILANLRRSILNKDRLYGMELSEKKINSFLKAIKSIVNGARYYLKTRNQ
ncbi:MAG: glycosyltransferase [Nanoarchaeota archaeon]|nr:glycosyltransferase [Nanoarchaeota archaeon]